MKNSYFVMSKKAADDERLSFEAVGVLAYIAATFGDEAFSDGEISEKHKTHNTKRALHELTVHGYISAR